MASNDVPQPATAQPLASPYLQEFGDQLAHLQRTAPGQIRTRGALASDLLADALLQYDANRTKAAAAQGAGGPNLAASGSAPTPVPGSSFSAIPRFSLYGGEGQ